MSAATGVELKSCDCSRLVIKLSWKFIIVSSSSRQYPLRLCFPRERRSARPLAVAPIFPRHRGRGLASRGFASSRFFLNGGAP